jgi:hypothetical protein
VICCSPNFLASRIHAAAVEATVKAIEELFETRMGKFKHRETGKFLVRHLGKASIPAHLAGSIVLVEGLHEFPGRKHTSNSVR